MQEQTITATREMLRLAGLELPQDRITALAAGAATFGAARQQLLAIDYGDAEPAARFRPPAAR